MFQKSLFQARNLCLILVLGTGLSACNFNSVDSTSEVEDTSASGVVAGMIGGAILAGNPTTLATGNTCPTVNSTSGCANGASGIVNLTYSGCVSATGSGSYGGTLQVAGSSLVCGATSLPSAAVFQYVNGAGTAPSVGSSTNNGSTYYLDDSSTNLSNFDTATLTATTGTGSGSGYGINVAYTSGAPNGTMTLNRRVYSVLAAFDYSLSGDVSVATASGTSTISTGTSLKIYNNRYQVVGTSTFTALTYNNTCCYPVSGSIQTAFAAGTTITTPGILIGQQYLTNHETLTFTGCGSATLKDALGYTSTVALTHCY